MTRKLDYLPYVNDTKFEQKQNFDRQRKQGQVVFCAVENLWT